MYDTGESVVNAITALVIAEPAAAAEAEEAVELAHGKTIARIGWNDVADLGPQSHRPILMVEAAGVPTATLAAALPRIAETVTLLELHAIVALDETQIDQVAAELLGERIQLLCTPTIAERVAALAVAAEMAGRVVLHDRFSEGEAARLAKLNEEVARIAEVLARLSRRDEDRTPFGSVADRRPTFDVGPIVDPEPVDPQVIRQAIRARRLRDKHFGAGLFEDPAWDMLLDLFAAHLERAEVSVSSLCIAAAVAPTTALRWIGRMTDAGLFERQPDPFDRRRAFMALSKTALEQMRAYVSAMRAQGLPIA